MPTRTLDFKCALITGSSGGIGLAMAKYLLSIDKKVIIAGRTESSLHAASEDLSPSSPPPYYVFDVAEIISIPSFVKQVVKEHPDIDCLINNAGVQRELHVQDFDLGKADQEIDTNIRGPMHLAMGFLEHFRGKDKAVIMNISSLLGFNPVSVINPVYNGTKAWVHSWSMNLRTQLLQDEGMKHIRVIEIAPPTVGTNLHRDREDPDDNKKEKNENALTVEEFMDYVKKGWEEDKDIIGAGMSISAIEKWEGSFLGDYEKAVGERK